jgi:2-alkyl-3-oxoalkanoate reductase
VALVGAGYVSGHHLRALKSLDGVEVVALADSDLSRARDVAARYGVPVACQNLAEFVTVKPDVVHILTPPSSHAELTIEALRMGCHVFVEKPMAENAADCDRMIAAATAAGRVLSVNHSARMDPMILKALEIVAAGKCGAITAVDVFRSSDYPPYSGGPNVPPQYRKGSYPLQDLGVHGLSIFEAFLGEVERTEVVYRSTGCDPNLLFDEWRALAHCRRGIGQMYLSWNVRPIRSEAIVYGTRGILHLDFFLQTVSLVHTLPGPKFLGSVVGALTNAVKTVWTVPLNVLRFATGKLSGAPGIHVSIRKFYEALQQNAATPIPATEGRRIVSAIEDVCGQADAERVQHRERQLRRLTRASVLVTGAGGFLGRRLVERLLGTGENVRVLVRRRAPEWEAESRIQVVCGDLGDPRIVDHAVEGVDTVFHVGAAMKGGAADFERGTIWGTRNVIESCLRHNVKRLVYVSSLSVLDHAGRNPKALVNESAPYEPSPELRGVYTQTKLQAERMVIDAVRENRLPAVILRPGQIFGAATEEVAPSGTIAIAGKWLVVGAGNRRLPLVFVEDVVDALLLARGKEGVVGSVFNIVDENGITQRDYVKACGAHGAKMTAVYVPYSVMYAVGWGFELLGKMLRRNLPITRYRVRSIRPLDRLDLTKAKKVLGWEPQVGTIAGIQQAFGKEKRQDVERAAVPREGEARTEHSELQDLVGSGDTKHK